MFTSRSLFNKITFSFLKKPKFYCSSLNCLNSLNTANNYNFIQNFQNINLFPDP